MSIKRPTSDEIKKILDDHAKWRSGHSAGIRADLTGANLTGANLRGANLRGADLTGAKNIPPVLIQPEEGGFFAFKKLRDPKTARPLIAKLWIPAEARRINSFYSRKCRAEYVEVVEIVGQAVKAETYDHDFRMDCAGGIHYLMTRKEAEGWQ